MKSPKPIPAFLGVKLCWSISVSICQFIVCSSLFNSMTNGSYIFRRLQSIITNVYGPSKCDFQVSKLLHLFRPTIKTDWQSLWRFPGPKITWYGPNGTFMEKDKIDNVEVKIIAFVIKRG